MESTFNTRSMIFTLYGDYIRHYGGEIWMGSLIRLLEEFGHNPQAVRAAISRMSKQGWVQARKEGNRSYYYLTERGKKRLDEAAERIFKLQQYAWDGKWRMLLYSIPEEKRHLRDDLRKELNWLGFGALSNSCYISPNPLDEQVKELITRYGVEHYVDFFHCNYEGPQESHQLVERCWNIAEINAKYKQFIEEYSQKYVLDKHKLEKQQKSDGECFVERTKLIHEYRKFLFIDPGLPESLLPEEWLGDHAAGLFRDYYQILAEPASRFFEGVFAEGNKGKREPNYDAYAHPYLVEEEQQ